jgi:hypothetical protein
MKLARMFASALALVCIHTNCIAAEPTYFDSLRLVAAMREDELMLLAIRATVEKRIARGELKAEDVECLERMKFPEVTDIPARRISEKLTAAEVSDGLAFFQGFTGRKFVRRTELALTGRLRAGSEAFSAADAAALLAFKQQPAGHKLLGLRIGSNAVAMSEAIARMDPVLQDCAYEREVRTERRAAPGYCESRPLASTDHVCLATYVTKEKSDARHEAEIRVNCERDGRLLQSTIENPHPAKPVALRWEEPRQLVILIEDPKMRIVSSTRGESAAQRVRFASRQAGDPPALKCLPRKYESTLETAFPVPSGVAAWRTYRDRDVCHMTSRVPEGAIPGQKGDVLLHFGQHKRPSLPFATTSLVFGAQISQPQRARLFLKHSTSRMDMIAMGNQQLHILEGRAATSLFNTLRSKASQISVQPSVGNTYVIPVSQQDFTFAVHEFEACLKSLGAKI